MYKRAKRDEEEEEEMKTTDYQKDTQHTHTYKELLNTVKNQRKAKKNK